MSGLILSDPLPRGWAIEKDTESVFSVFVPDAWWVMSRNDLGKTLHQMVTSEIMSLVYRGDRGPFNLKTCRASYDPARRGRVVTYVFEKE